MSSRNQNRRLSRFVPPDLLGHRRVNEERRIVTGVPISSEAIDEHSSIVIQAGIEPRHRNLPLLRDHDHVTDSVIGRAFNFRLTRIAGVAATLSNFAFGEDEQSQRIFRKFASGLVRDVSIGFISLKDRSPTKKERDAGAVEVIERARLLEVSVVAIASNPLTQVVPAMLEEALSQARRANVIARKLSAPGRRLPSGLELELGLLKTRLTVQSAALGAKRRTR